MSFVDKLSTRTPRRMGKGSLKLRRLSHAGKRYREERKQQKDVAGLLGDIVNLISIQQTPIAKIYSEYSYTFPFAKSTVKTPNNCSSLPAVCSPLCGSSTSWVNSEDHRTILPIVSYSSKSIFSKPKVLQTHRSIATQTNFEEDEATRLRPREAIINGRRIIDFQYFFEQLREVSNHSKALCNLNDIIITNEKKSGICTSYNLKCLVCSFEKEIYSENPYSNSNLNTDFVSGILSIDCNFMDSYVLLAQMHLPLLNNDEFIQESKNAYFPRDTMIRRMLLKSRHTFRNFRKNVNFTELAAMKQSLYAHENIQREHPLTIMQQCSSTSDNKNLFEQMHLGNMQREHQLTTTQHCSSVSDNSNIQRESQLTAMEQSSYAHKNIQSEHQLITTNQCSSMSDNNFFEQMHLGGLLVEDEVEIKEENVTEDENEFETIVPDQTMKISDDKLIADQEQAILNTITIKQEINSDDENFDKLITKENTNKESVIVNDEQTISRAMLTQANKARACENTMIVNQEEIQVQKKVMVENNKDINMLIKPEFCDMEIADEESVTNLYNKLESESPLKKVTYKESNNSRDTQGILKTAPSKKINVSQSRFESNRLVTATSTNLRNGTTTSNITNMENVTPSSTTNLRNGTTTSIITNVENVTPSSTTTNATATITTRDGGNVFVLMPLQDVKKKFNKNGAVITTLMPRDLTSGIYPGVRRTACMPEIASAMQQPANLSNVIPNASGVMHVPSESTVVQQPTDSSKAMPRVWDGSRIHDAPGTSVHIVTLHNVKKKQ